MAESVLEKLNLSHEVSAAKCSCGDHFGIRYSEQGSDAHSCEPLQFDRSQLQEMSRFSKAMKDPKFMALLDEYSKEISEPGSKEVPLPLTDHVCSLKSVRLRSTVTWLKHCFPLF